ncbi:ImmA/IrrE family metallo-endopeptidase [Cytobacillus firmus]|uniref:ImmA/IrrE family metallo-endopeptidase n=1 Tax=Cytobacillus firmus TaxID=1399 RepID=UPI003BA2844F
MIPDKVKVAGIEYRVQEVEDMDRQFDHLGLILYTKGVIKLDKNLSQDRKEQVFIHELLHGCFYEAGIEEQDEDIINRVSIVLYQVLKDNNLHFGKIETS